MDGAKQSHQGFLQNAIEPAAASFKANKNEEGVAKFLSGVSGVRLSLTDVPKETQQEWMTNLLEIWGYALTDTSVPIELNSIKELEAPTLLLVGDRSPEWLVAISKELNRMLPNSRLEILENSSHGLYFENPVDADRAVMEFLEEH